MFVFQTQIFKMYLIFLADDAKLGFFLKQKEISFPDANFWFLTKVVKMIHLLCGRKCPLIP